jgi:hypothetical protein
MASTLSKRSPATGADQGVHAVRGRNQRLEYSYRDIDPHDSDDCCLWRRKPLFMLIFPAARAC